MPSLDNAYALVIGIANYLHVSRLPATVLQDARDVHQLLTDSDYGGYNPEYALLLLDEDATQIALRRCLSELSTQSNDDSTLFLYISSHGAEVKSDSGQGAYLLPVDADATSAESLAQTAMSGSELTTALRAFRGRKMLVVLDCCHAGGIGQPKGDIASELRNGLPDSYYDLLKQGNGRVVMASSRADETSWILPGASHSLFTQHLLDGLRGSAPGPGGVIRVFDLFHYLQPKVVADQPRQHPIFKAQLEDNFPVALFRGGTEPSSPVVAPPDDGFAYDVFVSYRQQEPDRTWVRKVLVPRLEERGARACVDYRDFRLGAPLVTEMARAVEQSRYTLAVLSPRYLEGNFTQLESVLAEHLGLERSERRLLAIMREPTRPRLGMRARLWLDMVDDASFETDVARLSYEITQSPTLERAT
jgi:hypothetical protein